MRAVGARQLDEIGIGERGAVHPRRIFALLVHAYGAVHAVVDHDEHHVRAVLRRGREFLPAHQKAAVPVPRNHHALGMHDFGRDRGGHAVAHGAAGGRELGAECAVLIEAVQPAGVIPGAVGEDRVGGQPTLEKIHDVPQLQAARHGAAFGPLDVLRMRGRRAPAPSLRVDRRHRGERGGDLRHA